MGKNKPSMGKVKHYDHSFYTGSRRTKKLIGMAVLLIVLFLAGWLVGPAVIDFGTRLWYGSKSDSSSLPPESQPESQPVIIPDSEPETTPEITAGPTAEPTAQPTAVPVSKPGEGGWAFVSATAAKNGEQAAATAAQLAEQGVKYAVMTLKDAQGHVYYESHVEAARAGLSSTTFDAAAAARAFRAEGITPVAAIAAFRDPIAAGADRDMAVLYKDSDYLWLDRAREKGGKPWLNPASPEAVGYISDLISEAKSLGYEEIWLTDLSFPTASGRQKATFKGMDGRSIPQVLSDDLSRFTQLADCWVEIPLEEAIKGAESSILGAKPAELGIRRLVLHTDDAPDEEVLNALIAEARAGGVETVALLENGDFILK